MYLDDFDSETVALEVAQPQQQPELPDRTVLEVQQTEKFRRYRSARDLIVSPEVARALRDGWSPEEIAAVLEVDRSTVYKHIKSADMQVLLDREARRLLDHLTSRDLKDEKYRDLTLSLGVIIDKARILRDEPTQIIRTKSGDIARLAELLFGGTGPEGGGSESGPIIDITPEQGTGGVQELHGEPEQAGSEESLLDFTSGNEPGSAGQS